MLLGRLRFKKPSDFETPIKSYMRWDLIGFFIKIDKGSRPMCDKITKR